jgi:hypothetical protein
MFVPFNGRNGTASRETVAMASYQLSDLLSKASLDHVVGQLSSANGDGRL